MGGPLSIENRFFTDLPMHRDCASYALKVCPFLAAPSFAYSQKLPDGTVASENVSVNRPDRFGLGITRNFQPVRLGDGETVLRADPFEYIEWWCLGEIRR